MMDYEKIKAFITIAEYGALSEAAKKLYITQSALTYQVKALEDELRATLLSRAKGSHSTSLTPIGEAFVGMAKKLLEQWDNIRGTVELMAEQERLSVVTLISIGAFMLEKFCEKFSEAFPDGNIHLNVISPDSLYEDINAGKYDIGITYKYNISDSVYYRPVANERYIFVCRKDSEYPDNIKVSELDPRKEIFHFWGTEYNLWHDMMFGANGHYTETSGSILHIKHFFYGYRDWAILPKSVFRGLGSEFKTCECDDLPSKRTIYMIWKHERANNKDYERCFQFLSESLADADACFEIL